MDARHGNGGSLGIRTRRPHRHRRPGRDQLHARMGCAGSMRTAGRTLSDLAFRLGLTRAWAVSCLCIAATTALIGSAPQMVALSVAASGLFGAAYIATTGLLLITAASTYHQQPASGVGLSFLTLALGQAIGAPSWAVSSTALARRSPLSAAALTGLSAALAPPRPSAHAPKRSQSSVKEMSARRMLRSRTCRGQRCGEALFSPSSCAQDEGAAAEVVKCRISAARSSAECASAAAPSPSSSPSSA